MLLPKQDALHLREVDRARRISRNSPLTRIAITKTVRLMVCGPTTLSTRRRHARQFQRRDRTSADHRQGSTSSIELAAGEGHGCCGFGSWWLRPPFEPLPRALHKSEVSSFKSAPIAASGRLQPSDFTLGVRTFLPRRLLGHCRHCHQRSFSTQNRGARRRRRGVPASGIYRLVSWTANRCHDSAASCGHRPAPRGSAGRATSAQRPLSESRP